MSSFQLTTIIVIHIKVIVQWLHKYQPRIFGNHDVVLQNCNLMPASLNLKVSTASILLQIITVGAVLLIGYQALSRNRDLPEVPTRISEGFSVDITGIDHAPGFTEAEWVSYNDGTHALQFHNPSQDALIEIQFAGLPQSCEFAESIQHESQCLLRTTLNNTPYQLMGVGFLEINPLHYTSLFIDQIGINVIELSGQFSFDAASVDAIEIHVNGSFEKLIQPG